MSIVQNVVGLTKSEAMSLLTESGYKVRIVTQGGPPQLLTCDHNLGRITLHIKDDKVIEAEVG